MNIYQIKFFAVAVVYIRRIGFSGRVLIPL